MNSNNKIIVIGLLFLLQSIAFAQPKIEIVGGDTYDFGNVSPSVIHHDLKITNLGTDTLHIIDVAPGCECTTAPIDKKYIAPHDTATMNISVNVNTSVGQQRKAIMVSSNDPKNGQKLISLEAFVVQEVVSRPHSFPMRVNAHIDTPYTATVNIVNISDSTIEVNPPRMRDAEDMTVRFDMKRSIQLAPRDSFQLTAYITPLKKGMLANQIFLPTTSRYTRELNISLMCNVIDIKKE